MVRSRKGQDFRDPKADAKRQVICVHCASLGEFEQGRPLIEALRAKFKDARLVVTFFSPSGYEIRKNYSGADAVYYLPLDTPRAARRFIDQLQPDMLFLVKYEFWYNILRQARLSGTRIYIVSAIFRADMNFFAPAWRGGDFFRSILGFFDKIFVQDTASATLLEGIGLKERVVVAGDTRFDRVAGLTSSAPLIPSIKQFAVGQTTIVCGSTWPPDEQLLLCLMDKQSDWRFIIAPHEIEMARIDRLIEASGRRAIKYSQIEQATGDESLLVIDSIGILSSLYRYGQVAYIGGGFGVGIHNTLEAATWGVPVIFGPRYQKFREAVGLVECGAAASIENSDELTKVVQKFADQNEDFGAKAAQYVRSHIGATDTIMAHLTSTDTL